MNSAYLLAMGLTVLSNVVYHLTQKGISSGLNPLVSLAATYATALAATAMGLVLQHLTTQTGGQTPFQASAWTQLAWPSFVLGLAAMGLELGFLWAYRAGWKISMAALYSNALVTIALIPLGFWLFSEPLSLKKCLGVLLTCLGLWIVQS